MEQGDDETRRRNLLSLMPLDWVLMTFVFEENYSLQEGSENGIRFTFYVNDIPLQTNSGSTTPVLRNNVLKQNDGDLHLFPGFKGDNLLQMADIKYFNYAKSDVEVRRDFERKAKTLSQSDSTQNLYTSVQ
jgi:hypothetical protein